MITILGGNVCVLVFGGWTPLCPCCALWKSVATCTQDRRLWIWIWMGNFISTASLSTLPRTFAYASTDRQLVLDKIIFREIHGK